MLHNNMQKKTHQNNMQKTLGAVTTILGAMTTWQPEFVQACL
jgi:hypothetical protein